MHPAQTGSPRWVAWSADLGNARGVAADSGFAGFRTYHIPDARLDSDLGKDCLPYFAAEFQEHDSTCWAGSCPSAAGWSSWVESFVDPLAWGSLGIQMRVAAACGPEHCCTAAAEPDVRGTSFRGLDLRPALHWHCWPCEATLLSLDTSGWDSRMDQGLEDAMASPDPASDPSGNSQDVVAVDVAAVAVVAAAWDPLAFPFLDLRAGSSPAASPCPNHLPFPGRNPFPASERRDQAPSARPGSCSGRCRTGSSSTGLPWCFFLWLPQYPNCSVASI